MDQIEVPQELSPRLQAPPDEAAASVVGRTHNPGEAPPAFIFAVGRVEPRFSSLAVEKEFAQVTGRASPLGRPIAKRCAPFSPIEPTVISLVKCAGCSRSKAWKRIC